MLARPPAGAGEAPRCRSCGAGLPSSSGGSVACAHCGATNFLGDELTTRRAELLEAEAAEHRRRAAGWAKDVGAGRPTRAFYVGGLLGAVAALVLTATSLVLLVVAS
jgi:hypothetical protein